MALLILLSLCFSIIYFLFTDPILTFWGQPESTALCQGFYRYYHVGIAIGFYQHGDGQFYQS